MVRKVVLALAASILVSVHVAAQQASPEVDIGERFRLDSEILGEERPYWVYLPASYDDENYAPQSYPVLYLLDGDAHFHSATGVVQFMSDGINGNVQVPQMIVVAIPNTNRTRDLTPTESNLAYDGTESRLGESGGGDAFLRFMREELFPEIESTYRTRPYRIFVGHSLGGLIGLHALVDVPDMFQSIIAIDPSLWWDNQKLVRQAEEYFAGRTGLTEAVYITSANNPPAEPGAPQVMLETAQAFTEAMESSASPGLRPAFRYFEAEDHGSVPLLSLYHGLLHIFDGYKPSVAAMLEDPMIIRDHFAEVSERLGMEFLPPEPLVNQIALFMASQEDLDKAIPLLQLNVENYPESASAWGSLARGYQMKGDDDVALRHYGRALSLSPDNERLQNRIREIRESGSN